MLDRFRKRYAVTLRGGHVEVSHGRPPLRFVNEVADIARLHGIDRGTVECIGAGKHARLKFSSDFPQRGQQAIRNVWSPPTAARVAGPRNAG